ncbi:hypothetical protein LXL04_018401 [Taraxacum kok-saghyz]
MFERDKSHVSSSNFYALAPLLPPFFLTAVSHYSPSSFLDADDLYLHTGDFTDALSLSYSSYQPVKAPRCRSLGRLLQRRRPPAATPSNRPSTSTNCSTKPGSADLLQRRPPRRQQPRTTSVNGPPNDLIVSFFLRFTLFSFSLLGCFQFRLIGTIWFRFSDLYLTFEVLMLFRWFEEEVIKSMESSKKKGLKALFGIEEIVCITPLRHLSSEPISQTEISQPLLADPAPQMQDVLQYECGHIEAKLAHNSINILVL